MSKILDLLFADENRAAIDQVSSHFDLGEKETRAAVEELIPALSRGLEKNVSGGQGGGKGMDDLLEALRTGHHERYVDRPAALTAPETVDEGNSILAHVFGDKRTSREVANRAAERSGVSGALLKKMLPVLAPLVLGALSKRVLGGSAAPPTRSGSGGLLASLLDGDNDGSVWDDVLGMAARGLTR